MNYTWIYITITKKDLSIYIWFLQAWFTSILDSILLVIINSTTVFFLPTIHWSIVSIIVFFTHANKLVLCSCIEVTNTGGKTLKLYY